MISAEKTFIFMKGDVKVGKIQKIHEENLEK